MGIVGAEAHEEAALPADDRRVEGIRVVRDLDLLCPQNEVLVDQVEVDHRGGRGLLHFHGRGLRRRVIREVLHRVG